MPFTSAQYRLFRAAAHNKEIAKKHGLTMKEAHKLSQEGVKKTAHPPTKK